MIIDEDLAEIIGIHIGDGCISKNKRYSEYYIGGDISEEKEYHDTWVGPLFNKKIIIPLYNKSIKYKEYPKTGVYGAYIFDDKIVKFFTKIGIPVGSKINIRVPSKILKDKKLSLRFLRGLFDTDGTIYFDKTKSKTNPKHNIPIIKLGSVSKNLVEDVLNMLQILGFHPRIKKPYKGKRDKHEVHTILIYRKLDINKFILTIGFKNSKHYTKWELYKKIGYCPPNTTIKQRRELLKN